MTKALLRQALPSDHDTRGHNFSFFEELLEEHQNRVQSLAFHILGDAEAAFDVAQETFVRAFHHLERVRDPEAIHTWISRITVNLCRTFLRREKVKKRFHRESEYKGADPSMSVAAHRDAEEHGLRWMAREEYHRQIREEVAKLSEPFRLVIVLRDMSGATYEEVANVLGIPIGTVRSRLHKAREILRERLTNL